MLSWDFIGDHWYPALIFALSVGLLLFSEKLLEQYQARPLRTVGLSFPLLVLWTVLVGTGAHFFDPNFYASLVGWQTGIGAFFGALGLGWAALLNSELQKNLARELQIQEAVGEGYGLVAQLEIFLLSVSSTVNAIRRAPKNHPEFNLDETDQALLLSNLVSKYAPEMNMINLLSNYSVPYDLKNELNFLAGAVSRLFETNEEYNTEKKT